MAYEKEAAGELHIVSQCYTQRMERHHWNLR
ncbi:MULTISPECIES: IS1 family transposase [Xenorhabdus]